MTRNTGVSRRLRTIHAVQGTYVNWGEPASPSFYVRKGGRSYQFPRRDMAWEQVVGDPNSTVEGMNT